MKYKFREKENADKTVSYYINEKLVDKKTYDTLVNDDSLDYEPKINAMPENICIDDCSEEIYDSDIATFVSQIQSLTPEDAADLLQYELEITSALSYYAGERDALKSVRKSINEGIGNINDDESDFMINNGIEDE